jgi:hypothetical protein
MLVSGVEVVIVELELHSLCCNVVDPSFRAEAHDASGADEVAALSGKPLAI